PAAPDGAGRKAPPFRVGIVSRLRQIDYKGHGPLMRGMAAEPPEQRDWKLCVAGTGPAYWPMRYYAHKLKISDRVEFLGQVEDMPEFLRSLDMLVLGTTYETFGLALAEAMATALPVAAVRMGGMKEVVGEDGRCGELCSPFEREKLVGAVERCKNDPARATAMGRAGLERVREKFSIAAMTDGILNCYREVLA
ncbi:MAG: glycosyltransferase, partial [Victivallaceae bacterium]|nr:glycosyltransferase [Victivallaceae bacterium]